jgi:small ligand-binding sensory domain FIST
MPFAAAVSEHPLATHAVGEVVGQVLEGIGDRPDAAVLFVTRPFIGAMDDIAGAVRSILRPRALIGGTASSVLAGREEVEERAAVALFAMRSSGSRSGPRPRAVRFEAGRTPEGWHLEGTSQVDVPGATLVLIADPFSFPVDGFVDAIADETPGLTVVGGLASAGTAEGGNRLVVDDVVTDRGAVGLLLPPGLVRRAVVSQGCRPVGEPLVVTKASGNLVEEIAGQPALDRLLAQAEAATPEDRSLMARGLHIGLVIDEAKPSFERGDFLIRSVLGADHTRRAVAIGADTEIGSTVQFQVRDAVTADEDLRDALTGAGGDAALVFTCNGRGTNLFAAPHHDAEAISDHVDGGAVAGMFCAGEIGPVGDKPFVHGFTASVLLFDDR